MLIYNRAIVLICRDRKKVVFGVWACHAPSSESGQVLRNGMLPFVIRPSTGLLQNRESDRKIDIMESFCAYLAGQLPTIAKVVSQHRLWMLSLENQKATCKIDDETRFYENKIFLESAYVLSSRRPLIFQSTRTLSGSIKDVF